MRDTEREVSNKARWEEGHIERMYPLTANAPVLKIYTYLQGKVYRGDNNNLYSSLCAIAGYERGYIRL